MRLTVYGHTENGPRHEVNEDVIIVGRSVCDSGAAGLRRGEAEAGRPLLVAVADGMGNHSVGSKAGHLVLETLDELLQGDTAIGDMRMLVNALYNAAKQANRAVLDYASRDPEFGGMGCTMAGVLVFGEEYVVFNAGDSRVYRYRTGVLRQMTDDDTLVALAVRVGRITSAQGQVSPARHYVTNATGSRSFRLHVSESQPLEEGEAFVLSSDGLHGIVRLGRMEELLSDNGGAEERCNALVQSAKERGGYDDLSVIVINVEASGDAEVA